MSVELTSPCDLFGGEVAELVRARGLDPQREPAAFDALIDEALTDFNARAALDLVPPLREPEALRRALTDRFAGFGALQPLFDDAEVEEIWINSPAEVYVSRGGRAELTTLVLDEAEVTELVERLLGPSGRRLDLSSPFVDAALPDGSRLHVVIPDVTRRDMAINIRKFVARAGALPDLVALGSLTSTAAGLLDAAVRAGLNILVSGGTGTGKTTLLNALTASIPTGERVITCEEVFELRVRARDWVAMQCRQPSLEGTGEVRLRRLVKEALRMRPDRIIVGEVREAEAFDLLVALNSGIPGMCSIHSNSAREAITKLCTLPLLAGENVSGQFVVPTVALSVDLVVHMEMAAGGRRRVREIVQLTGRVEGDRIEAVDLFHRDAAGRLTRGTGHLAKPERFEALGIDPVELLAEPKGRRWAG